MPFSCKTRFCPSCGKVRTDAWANGIAQELLDVPHLHVTLTIAQQLWRFFHRDRSLLKVMYTVALQAVRELIHADYPGLRAGMVYTLHTYGRDLAFKPHVHMIVTQGGLDNAGNWVQIEGIPGNRLAAKWRYLLCKQLTQLRPYDSALRAVINDNYKKYGGFQVYTESFYAKGLQGAQYMGRYLGHPPLSTARILAYDGKMVHFWYTDTATGQRRDIFLSALEFISLLVQHIPAKGMHLMRHAGLYARSVKAKLALNAKAALNAFRRQTPLFDLAPFATFFKSLPWRERIKASFGYDPLECLNCGCIMELVEIWEPKRGHVWMKRWLETHRTQYRTNWVGMRKAARDALADRLAARRSHYIQLAFAFDTS